ncbi:arsenate reductase (glutaredoxin) [Pseudooceanicola onchidii]|uniref:arsenate reductase (glutaredoxin) n=1 Tax=Pseudooceanicola onchidii TaxID=2562279 RepID=UPI0010AB271D|nr:arsenate reductase (glutaredoxin) [Pseudooceanicola onchidii]
MILWHNPRCTKSRQTLSLIEGRGYQPRIRPYLNDPPSEDEIRAVLSMLGVKPIAMMRRREKRFAELGLTPETPDDTMIRAMAENPILIERPILIFGNQAAIGRPPEAVLPLLDD